MKGRPPTPLKLLMARGSVHAKYVRSNNPEPEGVPIEDAASAIPAWLSAGAREYWMTIAPILSGMDVLMTSDALALSMLCDAIVDYILMRDDVAKHGHTQITNSGEQPRPQVRMMKDSWANVVKLCEKFALTPVDRGRVKVEPKKLGGIATRKRA